MMSNDFPSDGMQRMIADRKGDRTYERLSRDCGGVPTTNRAHGMATKPMKSFPDADTMVGLARGLNASVTDVVLACAASVGLTVNRGPDPEGLVLHGAGNLPQSAQDALVDVSRQMQSLAGV